MKKLKQHVDYLFSNIPDNEENNAMKQEVLENLEEKVFDLMEQGKSEEDAINKAIVDFGDMEDLKRELGEMEPEPETKNNRKINLMYSIWGSALIIGLLVFINFYYSPNEIWFVYPTFGVLWWPLSAYFSWLRSK
ncbi:permease prefix domain 1-containing protein [Radiobacillus kanasensis]|uniref:permease prefix domain 1-containing protein n=1 Tax=Radiobacillus kanasensis TaxID=2844358 RepID=UPI001E552948|nr:permease prefix domain 1-containing protein [Radiobacillus kanasensis]UFU00222.1 permease prefix domain 1-containing protein [Radiobacillus kanasensis]